MGRAVNTSVSGDSLVVMVLGERTMCHTAVLTPQQWTNRRRHKMQTPFVKTCVYLLACVSVFVILTGLS